jgi:hypothetical protein
MYLNFNDCSKEDIQVCTLTGQPIGFLKKRPVQGWTYMPRDMGNLNLFLETSILRELGNEIDRLNHRDNPVGDSKE